MGPTFKLEKWLIERTGAQLVAGFDEVGMGAYAGPVVVAGVILEPRFQEWYDKLDDSKKLRREVREELADIVARQALAHVTVDIWPREIDELGVYQARNRAMTQTYAKLRLRFSTSIRLAAIVDGWSLHGLLPPPSCYLDRADEQSHTVAAASIVAKVLRDNIMQTLATSNPGYESWVRNVGYGTKEHQKALEEYGPCSIHRFSFQPVYEAAVKRLNRGRSESFLLTTDLDLGHATSAEKRSVLLGKLAALSGRPI